MASFSGVRGGPWALGGGPGPYARARSSSARDGRALEVRRIPPVRRAREHALDHGLERLERERRVRRIERDLIELVAPARGRVEVRVAAQRLARVAVAAEVVEIVVALEDLVLLEQPLRARRDEGPEQRGGRLAVALRVERLGHVVQQAHDDHLLVLARAQRALRVCACTRTNSLEAPAEGQVPATTASSSPSASASMLPVVSGEGFPSVTDVLAQPAVRKAMPAIITLLTIVVFLIAYSLAKEPPYRSLYPGLSESDRQAAFEALSGAEFDVKINPESGDLIVTDERYHEARLFLASRGLPQEASVGGVGSLSEDASMTTSQFMEQVRYIAAMEQELARSISQIGSIQGARVHLASPKQSVFVRDRTPAKASVVVTPLAGRVVSASQVQAIVHMVASSVPHLSADDVSVVDQRGKLLTDMNSFVSMQLNSEQMSHKQRMEETYRNRIDAFLTPVVGLGNVRSAVSYTHLTLPTKA